MKESEVKSPALNISGIVFDTPVEETDKPIIFEPNPGPQTDFLSASEREVLYGGAAGGGKSYALLADVIRDVQNPNFNGLIVRRTNDELRELKQKSQELYKPLFGNNIKWKEQASEWVHSSGGRIWMTYLEHDKDVMRYQGQAFTYIGFDELTQWPTPFAWNYLRSRLRTTDPTLGRYMRATTNSGGPGHSWVKKMFVDPAPWGTAFWATDEETGRTLTWPKGHSREGQPLFKRRFIPAKLSDNPYLYEGGDYEAMLLSLPENERQRLLYGNWDVMEGSAFPEWNREVHVIEPFEIPKNWRRFRAADYGYGSFSAVLWFAISPSDQLIVYRELYVSKVLAVDLEAMVLDAEKEDGTISYGLLDSSCWAQRGDRGPSIAEQMSACRWRPSDRSKGSRIAGKNHIHKRLQVDEFTGSPGIVFFDTCVNTIAQLPVIPLDPNNPEDVDTKSEDHIYDALRYGVSSRPVSSIFDYNPDHHRGFTMADSVFGY